MNRVDTFLEMAVNNGGSDLHLVCGQAPRIRIGGTLHRIRFRELSSDDMERVLDDLVPDRLRQRLAEHRSIDFAYAAEGLGRFRVSAYHHMYGLAVAMRVIPATMRTLGELGLAPSVKQVIDQPSGLTLVTGPTGSGKSTTLAAMVDHVNATRRGHIITIEDPIEFLHEHKKCSVTQREVGFHSPSFYEALRNALREDPDVVMVGELRDIETISMALTAAETGIQVMGSLHTSGAVRTAERIVNVFPARQQEQVRLMLAGSLRLIVSQQLVPRADGSGRLMVAEVLVNNHASASLIRSGKAQQLMTVIQSSGKAGMQGMDVQLKELVRKGAITADVAYRVAVDKSHFEQHVVREEVA